MITMTELARIAGVSQPTVSRVLNGNPSVNPDVAKRVLDCAKQHNYQPNLIARSLNGNKTYLLAAIVPDISNPYFAELIKALEREAGKMGYSILIFNSDYDHEKELHYLKLLQQYRVDGLFLAPACEDAQSLLPFHQLSIPWLVVTNYIENADSIYISHEKAGQMVASHLVDVKAKRFLFIGRRKDRKFLGFERGLRGLGVDTRQCLTVFWEETLEETLSLMAGYLEDLNVRAGIFATNDMDALVTLHTLVNAGIDIPGKAALVGFDNTFISQRTLPGITSVSQPIGEMARLAIEHLLLKMKEGAGTDVSHVELTATLAVRASTLSDTAF